MAPVAASRRSREICIEMQEKRSWQVPCCTTMMCLSVLPSWAAFSGMGNGPASLTCGYMSYVMGTRGWFAGTTVIWKPEVGSDHIWNCIVVRPPTEFVAAMAPADSARTGAALSIARMQSPTGWVEPGQRPEFDEYTVVLRGSLRVESRKADGTIAVLEVAAGQAVIARRGEWVRYSTPGPEGADYIAICHPAFAMDTVHRDE